MGQQRWLVNQNSHCTLQASNGRVGRQKSEDKKRRLGKSGWQASWPAKRYTPVCARCTACLPSIPPVAHQAHRLSGCAMLSFQSNSTSTSGWLPPGCSTRLMRSPVLCTISKSCIFRGGAVLDIQMPEWLPPDCSMRLLLSPVLCTQSDDNDRLWYS